MNILSIDSSNNNLTVALKKGQQVFSSPKLDNQKHLVTLLPQIDKILCVHNLKLNDIDYLSVVTGPGSFTGVRIGVATAKAFLKVNSNMKAVEINALDMLAYSSPAVTKSTPVKPAIKNMHNKFPSKIEGCCVSSGVCDELTCFICVIPSTAEKIYAGFYSANGYEFKKLNEDKLLSKAELQTLIKSGTPAFCGSNNVADNCKIVDIKAQGLINFTEYLINKGQVCGGRELKPYYLALCQAEENLKLKNKN